MYCDNKECWYYNKSCKENCSESSTDAIENCPNADIRQRDKIEYKKYEFCKAVGCISEGLNHCPGNCGHSAWEFHNWLKENNYEILKRK